jgi:hypothetical protein
MGRSRPPGRLGRADRKMTGLDVSRARRLPQAEGPKSSDSLCNAFRDAIDTITYDWTHDQLPKRPEDVSRAGRPRDPG